jgi:hypothetical protein
LKSRAASSSNPVPKTSPTFANGTMAPGPARHF